MDNFFDQKRNNDPYYSDLFDQCKETGGQKHSPIRKQDREIGSVERDWTDKGLEQKLKKEKEYVNYNPKQQKINEFSQSNTFFTYKAVEKSEKPVAESGQKIESKIESNENK